MYQDTAALNQLSQLIAQLSQSSSSKTTPLSPNIILQLTQMLISIYKEHADSCPFTCAKRQAKIDCDGKAQTQNKIQGQFSIEGNLEARLIAHQRVSACQNLINMVTAMVIFLQEQFAKLQPNMNGFPRVYFHVRKMGYKKRCELNSMIRDINMLASYRLRLMQKYLKQKLNNSEAMSDQIQQQYRKQQIQFNGEKQQQDGIEQKLNMEDIKIEQQELDIGFVEEQMIKKQEELNQSFILQQIAQELDRNGQVQSHFL